MVLELNVTATVDAGDAQPVGVAAALEVGLVEDVGGLLEVGGGEPPDPLPTILMSAHVRYICGVWNEFHLKESSVWLLV